jgi:hypothetical protein
MANSFQVISADSHLEVSTDRWMHRVPQKYQDRAPRRLRLPGGGDAHIVERRGIMIEPVRVTGEWRVYPFGGRFGENPGSGLSRAKTKRTRYRRCRSGVLYPG